MGAIPCGCNSTYSKNNGYDNENKNNDNNNKNINNDICLVPAKNISLEPSANTQMRANIPR